MLYFPLHKNKKTDIVNKDIPFFYGLNLHLNGITLFLVF